MSAEEKRAESAETSEPDGTTTGQAEADLAATIGRLQRLQAEFENYKKRTARDIGSLEGRVTDQVILDFLEPYENLKRALDSLASDKDPEAFTAGVERIHAQFEQILEQRGVKRIPAVGMAFDPVLHEALLAAPSEEEKNTIIEELSPGYRRGERVLRVSRVVVSQGPVVQEESS